MEPLGVKRRNVPHFKGLICAKVDLEAQGHDSTFIICHALLKKAILHYKRALASFVLSTTVATVQWWPLEILRQKSFLLSLSNQ